MIIRPNKQEVEDYFSSPIISQSKLKLLCRGVDVFNATGETEAETMFYEEKTHFILGHAAEMKLQNGIEEYNNTYHMSEISKPSDKLLSITQQVFDLQSRMKEPTETFKSLGDHILKEDIETAIKFHEYYPAWTMDVKRNKVITACENYYQDLINSYGKQILDLNESTVVDAIVNSLQQSERTNRFFHEHLSGGSIDYHYQFPIYFTYLGVEFKALLDILEINYAKRTLKVIDIKTLGDYTSKFPSSVRKFRYDFQVAFYTIAINWWRKNICTDPIIKTYKIVNPAFMVETTRMGSQGNPLVFDCSDSLIDIALYGRKVYNTIEHTDDRNMIIGGMIQSSNIYGIIDTVKLYKWHLENGFEVDKVVREADSKRKPLTLDWEGVHDEDTIR